jgi:hypothetical protein
MPARSKKFALDRSEYLEKLGNTPYQNLTLLADLMKLVPLCLRKELKQKLSKLLGTKTSDESVFFRTFYWKRNNRRHFYFSE